MDGESWWNDRTQVGLLAERLAALRVGRRDAVRFAAAVGVATFGAACAPAPPTAPGQDTGAASTPAAGAPPAPTAGVPPAPAAGAPSTPAAPASTTPAAGAASALGDVGRVPGTFRRPVDREPRHFDFNADLYAGNDWQVTAGLLKFDPDLRLAADLAETWEPNADRSVWTFTLRRGATWSNGDPITAHDFVWSWTRMLDPATASPQAGFFYDIKNAEAFNKGRAGVTRASVGVTASDDRTLVVELEGPRGYFPVLTAHVSAAPVPRAAIEKHGPRWTEPATGVWSGPFKLTRWEHERFYVLDRNERYWDAANIRLRRVVRPIMPFASWLLAYENDEIDYVERGPIGDLPRVQGDPRLSREMFTFALNGVWYLVPHVRMAPFDVQNVRRALAQAIDREALVTHVLRGIGQPAYTLNPPEFSGYNPARHDDLTRYDPAAAMRRLEGTPYAGGRGWPRIVLTQRDEGDAPRAVATAMIQMLKQNLGMTIEHVVGEPREVYDRMFKGEIQLMWVRWYADYPDPNNTHWQVFYGGHTSGRRQVWQNDTYDQLVTTAKGIADPTRQMAMYQAADRILLEDAAAIFVYYPRNYGLLKPRVAGMPRNRAGEIVPNWGIFVRMYDDLTVT